MRSAGFLLLAAGFLGAAYFTVLDIRSTAWQLFVPAALVAIAGVYLIKRHARGEAQSEHALTNVTKRIIGSGQVAVDGEAARHWGSD